MTARRAGWIAVWLVLALPALYQLALLAHAVGGRFSYPYDLEWMEGGMLQHAQRISDGQGIYVAPSIDFIPYLYTPLYPGLIALFGSAIGISYQLGRALSIVSLLGIGAITIASIVRWRPRVDARIQLAPGATTSSIREDVGSGPRWVGAALAFGVFAAWYPYVEGWYDLVRADTLALFLLTAGILACARWARAGVGGNGDALMMAAATILVLSFFAKQTGVFYVGWGGIVIAASWLPELGRNGGLLARRIGRVLLIGAVAGVGLAFAINVTRAIEVAVPFTLVGTAFELGRLARPAGILGGLRRIGVYTLTATLLGCGGVFLLNRITRGWFWTYVFKVHQAHDFNMDRFWLSFSKILWHFPALTIVIATVLVVVVVTAIARPVRGRRFPEASGPFLLWTSTYALSTVVGAVGWGTEFAFYNAYMPALLHGALAVGAAVPALAGCVRAWAGDRKHAAMFAVGAAAAVAVAIGITLIHARWEPGNYIPRERDRAAGAALVARIAATKGEVWTPSHPWYAHLAGKRMFAHRMGITDVTARKPRPVLGLDAALRDHRFTAIVVDQHDAQEIPGVKAMYRADTALPGNERPKVYTGASSIPMTIWVPVVKETPPFGTRVLFDFESGRWDGWQTEGSAWGRGPANAAVSGQALVGGFGGRFFATSMHDGDEHIGTLISPTFVLDGSRITLRLGGGISDKLRVELRIDGRVVRAARPHSPVSERLTEEGWDIADIRGQTAQIVAIDDETSASWGHLNLDEIWLWP